MRSLYESLLDDEEEVLDRFDKEFFIKSWINQNYTRGGDGSSVDIKDITVRKEGDNYIVDIINDGGRLNGFYDRMVLNENAESITNGEFIFGEVDYFYISSSKIKDLYGMPSKFSYFYVTHCNNLKEANICIQDQDAKIFLDYCSGLTKVNVDGTCWELRCQGNDRLKEVKVKNTSGVDTTNCKSLEFVEINGHASRGQTCYIRTPDCKKLKKIISNPPLHHLDCKGCTSLEIIDANMSQIFNSVDLSKCKKITKWPILGSRAEFAVVLDSCTSLTNVSQLYGSNKLNFVGKTLSFKGCSNLVISLDDIPEVMGGILVLKGVKECPHLHEIFMNKRVRLKGIKMG